MGVKVVAVHEALGIGQFVINYLCVPVFVFLLEGDGQIRALQQEVLHLALVEILADLAVVRTFCTEEVLEGGEN
jgi:hypothetical protein